MPREGREGGGRAGRGRSGWRCRTRGRARWSGSCWATRAGSVPPRPQSRPQEEGGGRERVARRGSGGGLGLGGSGCSRERVAAGREGMVQGGGVGARGSGRMGGAGGGGYEPSPVR